MAPMTSASGEQPQPEHTSPTLPTAPSARSQHERHSAGSGTAAAANDSGVHGRFTPGQMIADRYRIVALLGRGGMGVVYRADDLRLGQGVALKFLPAAFSSDASRLERFRTEVRVTRQVSHRNVCRVYDLGELPPEPGASPGAPGDQYLSMEYVDGEDLASLLRRIGRLPHDKALEIARQMCAGLAAAHEAGVIHRDLKPANIMLDGRGQVRITDFGVAALASDARVAASEIAGTPVYMAPEQLEGREVSVRSDLYSLGLILYEVFTGRKAFERAAGAGEAPKTLADLLQLRLASAPTKPSSVVADLHPAVERAILRCLSADPKERPASALALLAALPGGDPLAEALAAGETPSPQLVAASGGAGVLRPAVAWSLATLAVTLLVLGTWLWGRHKIYGVVPLDLPPEALAVEARKVLKAAGLTQPPADTAYGFTASGIRLNWIRQNDQSARRWERLREPLPHSVVFWWRQSPTPFAHTGAMFGTVEGVRVTLDAPPIDRPGHARVLLTPQGRLISLEIERNRFIETREGEEAARPAFDWTPMLAMTGLDPASMKPSEPIFFPQIPANARSAWSGTLRTETGDEQPYSIEAGTLGGEPAYFRLVWRNHTFFMENDAPPTNIAQAAQMGSAAVTVLLLAGSVVLARRNIRAGRGDRPGAWKLGVLILTLSAGGAIIASHELLNPSTNWFFFCIAYPLLLAAITAGMYLGLEPFARRVWPTALVSWSRVVAGRWRDALAARDVLAGAIAGAFTVCMIGLVELAPALGLTPTGPFVSSVAGVTLASDRVGVASLCAAAGFAPLRGFASLLLLAMAQMLLRRRWATLAATGVMLMLLVVGDSRASADPLVFVVYAAAVVVSLFMLVRFGVLAMIVADFVSSAGSPSGLPDFSRWDASANAIPLVAVIALIGAAAHFSTKGRAERGAVT